MVSACLLGSEAVNVKRVFLSQRESRLQRCVRNRQDRASRCPLKAPKLKELDIDSVGCAAKLQSRPRERGRST